MYCCNHVCWPLWKWKLWKRLSDEVHRKYFQTNEIYYKPIVHVLFIKPLTFLLMSKTTFNIEINFVILLIQREGWPRSQRNSKISRKDKAGGELNKLIRKFYKILVKGWVRKEQSGFSWHFRTGEQRETTVTCK